MSDKHRWRHYCVLVARDKDHVVTVFSDLFTCPEYIDYLGKRYSFTKSRTQGGYAIYGEMR